MAISYNTGTTAFVTNSGTASGTVTIPAGVLSGDTVLVAVMVFTTATGTITPTLTSSATTPVQLSSSPQSCSGGSIITVSGLWSIAAGASDPSATLTFGASGGSGGSYWFNVGLVSYTGAGGVDVNAGNAAYQSAWPGNQTSPSATTGVSGDWQVQLMLGGPPNGDNYTVPGTLTSRQSITSATNAGLLLNIADSNGSVGGSGTSIGNTTWTCGSSGATQGWQNEFTVGIKPPGGANPSGTRQPLPTFPLSRRGRAFIAAWAGFSPRAGGQQGTVRPVPRIQPLAAQPQQRPRGPRVSKDSWVQVSTIAAGNSTATAVTSSGMSGASYGGVAVHYTLNLGNPAATWMHRTGGRRSDLAIASSQTANSQSAAPSVVGGTAITWRTRGQMSRAVIGNGTMRCAGGLKGQIQPPTFKLPSLTLLFIPRRYPARVKLGPYQGIVGGFAGSLQPRPPPPQILSSAVPPRRTVTRAVVRWFALFIRTNGSQQPRATIQLPRRYPARALVRNVAGQIQPKPSVQPRPTIPVPRRYPSRAGFWAKSAGQVQPAPSVQPRATVPVPRRYPSRSGFWRAVSGAPVSYPAGTVQPRATLPPARRYPARAVTRSATGAIQPASSVQPRATVPVPRRYPARQGLWHGVAGAVQPAQFIQPRPTVPVPRRYPARAGLWSHASGAAAGAGQPGTIQPRPTLPPRRTSARALCGRYLQPAGGLPGPRPAPAGTIQPRPSLPPPRRYPSRQGSWRTASGTAVSYPAGTVQPRAAVPVPRRYPSRAGFWEKAAGAPGAPSQPSGSLQPRATIPVSRRTAARALTAHSAGQVQPKPSVQPRPTVPLPRRAAARVLTSHSAPYAGQVPGSIQPRPTVPVPRRYPSRAGQWRGFALFIQVVGKIQPRATIPVPRRYPPRAGFWESAAGQAAHIGPGVLQPRPTVPLPRRYPSRAGFWESAAGAASAISFNPAVFEAWSPRTEWETGELQAQWTANPPQGTWTTGQIAPGGGPPVYGPAYTATYDSDFAVQVYSPRTAWAPGAGPS